MPITFTKTTILAGLALVVAGLMMPPAAAAQDAVKKGQEVYTAQKCQVCHQIAGKGNKNNPLDGVGAKLSAADTKKWIVSPTEMMAQSKSTKKPPMPNKYASLPAGDIDALVAYMQSLK
ncbi:MAG TPA: cytochrome c [Vicinamibacterales bacterium]|jgi:mono/diheme cytochrome c family protein